MLNDNEWVPEEKTVHWPGEPAPTKQIITFLDPLADATKKCFECGAANPNTEKSEWVFLETKTERKPFCSWNCKIQFLNHTGRYK